MTTTLKERNILVKDADGNWYAIPLAMEQEFIRIKEDTINHDFGSAEWHESSQEMQNTFGEYAK